MTTDELEQLLEARGETPTLDFKRPCPWNIATYAKDLLAMTNVPDGGRIVVGVDDGSFERKGISPEIRETYDADIMRDQMARFADPHVQFDCECVNDRGGLEYVVITVHPFREIPVICRIDNEAAGIRGGVIYFRSSHRRPESAPVATSYDMRTIVIRSAARMRRTLADYGFVVPALDEKRFDDELQGL